jgi:hypothetical protein
MSGIDFLFEHKAMWQATKNQLIFWSTNNNIDDDESKKMKNFGKELKQTMNLWNREEISKLNAGYFFPRPFPLIIVSCLSDVSIYYLNVK